MGSVTTYKITLEDDGYDAIILDASSFSYRATSNGSRTGSVVVKGLDDADDIADRSGGDLKLYKTVDGSDSLILTGTLDVINTFLGPTEKSLGFDFEFNFEESFRVPTLESYYQPNTTVIFDGVAYGIGDISVSASVTGGSITVSTTLNEGEVQQQSDGDDTSCTLEIIPGTPETSNFSQFCQIYSTGQASSNPFNPTFSEFRNVAYYDGKYILFPNAVRIKMYYFYLDDTYTVTVTYDGPALSALSSVSDPDYSVLDPTWTGSQLTIAPIDPFTESPWDSDWSTAFARLSPGGTFNGSLDSGYYTIRLIQIEALSTIPGAEYTLEVGAV